MNAHTEDTLYQGRVKLFQPETGFRAGTDSLLLAAALEAAPGTQALELGCGAGGALLTAAYRLTDTHFTGVEFDRATARLAEKGVEANAFAPRVGIEHAEASEWVRGHENKFDLVFANPPYFESGHISAPGDGKAAAYLETLSLEAWIKAMAFAAKPRATLVLIHRAADLARLLLQLDRQCGEITILPIAPKSGDAARRVLIRARKGLKRGPVSLLSPLVLHADDGAPSDALRRIREACPISW